MQQKLEDLFRGLKVLVIGDIMLDTYIWGKAERLSPEAPVPVVEVEKRTGSPGGAANVAANLKSLGAIPFICSITGEDLKGEELFKLLDSQGINTQGIIKVNERVTTTKFRIIANKTQLLRVDEEMNAPLDAQSTRKLLQRITQVIESENPSAIIFQDYDKGVITPLLIESTISLANEKNIPVCVDPKRRNFMAYQKATLFKPNLKEFREGIGATRESKILPERLEQEMSGLQETLQCEILMVTLSDKGMALRFRDKGRWRFEIFPAEVRQVADVSGAGDTVISVAALGLAAGLTPPETAILANLAGGIVCEELGVVPINLEKLQKEYIKLQPTGQ